MLALSSGFTPFDIWSARVKAALPFNPMGFSTAAAPAWATAMTENLVFNAAASFTTNIENWQAYSGENPMSYFSQMFALAFHNSEGFGGSRNRSSNCSGERICAQVSYRHMETFEEAIWCARLCIFCCPFFVLCYLCFLYRRE